MTKNMKLNKLFLIGFVITGLASCVSEDIKTSGSEVGKGHMKLDVSILQPEATRANSELTKVTNFPVYIYNSNGDEIQKYDRVSDFPSTGLILGVGDYSVVSHTPGEIEKKMTVPYYSGTEPMEIIKDIETNTTVVCKMQNSKIEVKYSEEFLSLFGTWTISIDDGGSDALSFTHEDGTKPAVVYWLFEENVEKLSVNFRGTLKNGGGTVTTLNTLDKAKATEKYDNDNQCFAGGDALVLYFDPTEATTGKVTGVTINATISFDSNTTKKTEILDITDKSLKPDDGSGDNPGGDDDKDKPSFVCPELETGVIYSIDDEEYPNTQVKILTPKGMKSLKVSITGGNDGFAAACEDIGLTNYELVGDTKLPATFAALGVSDATMPQGGETEYSFPVGAFYVFMNIYGETDPGKSHTFKMVVTDNDGNTKEATLRVTITE